MDTCGKRKSQHEKSFSEEKTKNEKRGEKIGSQIAVCYVEAIYTVL